MSAERALAIFAFFGELEAPLQLVSGNSTIIVFDGALGTDTTRWMSRSSSSDGAQRMRKRCWDETGGNRARRSHPPRGSPPTGYATYSHPPQARRKS
jgi:hypothetical protein